MMPWIVAAYIVVVTLVLVFNYSAHMNDQELP